LPPPGISGAKPTSPKMHLSGFKPAL